MEPGDVNDIMHQKRAWRILGIWEKSELSFSIRRRRLIFGARWGLAVGAACGLGQIEKSA